MELHGGNIYDKSVNLDFSISVNPFGLPEKVRKEAFRGVEMAEHYPDIHYTALRKSIREYFGITGSEVALGNGATELIYTLVHVKRPRRALIIGPTFIEYERALETEGCKYEYFMTKEEEGFELKREILDYLEENEFDMLFLCNPNNPTGKLVKRGLLREMIELCERKSITFMIDECFMSFVKKEADHSYMWNHKGFRHLVILRAFTKTFAMPGLRLGYAVSEDTDLMEKIRLAMPPWNVSVPAQYAGVAAMKEIEYLKETKTFIYNEREWMEDQLEKIGFEVIPSKTNFILFRGPQGLQEVCMEKGILIRDAGSFRGMREGYYRIGLKKRKFNTQLLKVLHAYMVTEGTKKTWRG